MVWVPILDYRSRPQIVVFIVGVISVLADTLDEHLNMIQKIQ